MAVLDRDAFFERVKERIGDATDDETLAFVEDITDTYNDMVARAKGDGVDWRAKYEESENTWRRKYRERFFAGDPVGDVTTAEAVISSHAEDSREEEKEKTFDELFEERKD